jgi:hypothetical protein
MGVEFGIGFEKLPTAAGAEILTGTRFGVERAGAGPLRAVLAQHAVLFRRQDRAPLLFGSFDRKLISCHRQSPFSCPRL